MVTNAKHQAHFLRVCLLSVLAAALVASTGCRTRSYYDLPWDDVTGRKRDRAALDADYEKCRTEGQQAFLHSQGAPAATGRVVEQAGADTTFLACMERSGWKPSRGAAT